MKAFQTILIFTLFLSIFCSTTFPDVYSLYYNYAYVIIDSHSSDFLPPSTYYGKIKAHRNDNIEIQFRVDKDIQIAFDISVVTFDHDPSDSEVMNYASWTGYNAVKDISPVDYDIYKYPSIISTDNYNYIAIRFTTLYSLYHLTFFAMSQYYNYIKDIDYNVAYYADMSIFSSGVFPDEFHYYFRVNAFSEDNMEIQLETTKVYTANSFKVDVCQYKSRPTTANVYGDYVPTGTACNDITYTNIDKGSVYDTHRTEFTTNKDINYLAVHIACYIPGQNYLKFYIYSETGLKVGIIILIVVLAVALVGGGVGYGVKRARRSNTI